VLRSLAPPTEIAEILWFNDQSTDRPRPDCARGCGPKSIICVAGGAGISRRVAGERHMRLWEGASAATTAVLFTGMPDAETAGCQPLRGRCASRARPRGAVSFFAGAGHPGLVTKKAPDSFLRPASETLFVRRVNDAQSGSGGGKWPILDGFAKDVYRQDWRARKVLREKLGRCGAGRSGRKRAIPDLVWFGALEWSPLRVRPL